MIIYIGLFEFAGLLLKLSDSEGSVGKVYKAQARAALNKLDVVGETAPNVDMPGEVAQPGLSTILANGFSALRCTRLTSKNFGSCSICLCLEEAG